MLSSISNQNQPFFRSLFSPWGMFLPLYNQGNCLRGQIRVGGAGHLRSNESLTQEHDKINAGPSH
jgi:hypothetical protein